MRIILKIIAAPFVPVLTLLWTLLVFVFCWGRMLLSILSGISGLLSIILFFTGQTTGGIVYAIISFLISPVGIPAIVEWLIDRVFALKEVIKDFVIA